jgi:hypothetical protein
MFWVVKMVKPRVPVPTSERETEIWRILLQKVSDDALTTTDVLGTANQVIVTINPGGTITLSLPQDIDTDADVTFDTLTIDKIIFNLLAGLTPSEGELCWNSDDGTLNLGMPGGNVVLQIGQEVLTPRARATGSNIDNGNLVYVSGATGAVTEMSLAKADSGSTASGTIAMATEDITQNQQGYYTAFGLARDIDTSLYTEGDQLYLSPTTAGGFTDVAPTSPNYTVKIGTVIRAHAIEGIILVNISNRTNNFVHITGMTANLIPYADANGFLTEIATFFFNAGLHLKADSLKQYFGAGDDMSVFYDGTDGDIKTNEVAASDLKVECGANKTLELQNIVYEDIQFSISGGRVPASNAPTFSTFTTNTKEYQFDVDDFLYLSANEYAHSFKNAASWSFHLHVTTDSANASGSSQYTKFTLYVAYADTSDTWTETSVTAELEIPDGTSSLQAFILSLGTVSPSKNIGTQIKLTIKRITATGGTEYPDEIFLTQVGLHGEVNTMGSRQIGTK